ncbi:hypothetical protein PILCRDRAFT_89058 [Piloderma croceum F 1598]|uniref:Zn(2)-C6 fungal-type domain-containing protein n=1 Tax=Piloderma croceum (strain F 1598) TaxID=765440 RepID=A0A0C3BW35_PILCF|nr:hypothetical protein PILCRDRAFT_89058 [Piloderma croceum F 1598]
MADSISSEFSNSPSSTQPEYKRRSNIACNGCRKLKMKCDNINMETCQRCIRKNITCEYSEASPSPTFSTPPASLYQPATVRDSHEWNGYSPTASSTGKRLDDLGWPKVPDYQCIFHAGYSRRSLQSDSRKRLQYFIKFQSTRSDPYELPLTSSHAPPRCNNPNEHGCVVPQTPVQNLSEEMDSLNREIAERQTVASTKLLGRDVLLTSP